MRLEESWVRVGPGSSLHAHAAVGFLHHDREDEGFVDTRGGRDVFNGRLDVSEFLLGVVNLAESIGAGLLHDVLVDVPQVVEGKPLVLAGPAFSCCASAAVRLDVRTALALSAAFTAITSVATAAA